jgi:hypothetical protein
VNSASAAASGSASVQSQLASAEASVTALTDQNAQLTASLDAANKKIASGKSTGSSTSTATIAVTSRVVTPSSVSTSGAITMTAKVTGHPARVTMRVYNTSKGFDQTYSLHRVSTSGNTETWRAAVKAPSKTGTYHYYATAIKGSVRKTMTGASPRSFTVH